MAYTQEHRILRIATELGDDELFLTGFKGREELSRLFRFDLTLLSHNPALSFEDIIGTNVTVSLLVGKLEDGQEVAERHFNGIIASFTQVTGNVLAPDSGVIFSEYQATMVPWPWLLTKSADLRIFQNKSAVEIIEQIFADKGFSDYENKLNGTYKTREYCVQYRETDFNFISRLLEEEGIFYFFTHENGRHSLVLADSPDVHLPCPYYEKVRCQQSSSGIEGYQDEDSIKNLVLRNEIRSGKYTLNDYNYLTPATSLLVEVDGKQNLGPGDKEMYDYPGLFAVRAEGDARVTVRIQEEEARITSISGTSDVRGFASGFIFTLEDYFRDEMNNKKYLLVAVDHLIKQSGFGTEATASGGQFLYSNSFSCMPQDVPFRPRRLTPKPVVEGVQTAMVVGPAGEEIHTDEHGRIKVQFHWDREGQSNDKSSCWLRVGQIWAGAGWGSMFIPRIGHEVIVDFIEGDPDRPIVIGSVYHGTNKPPYPLPEEKTKTTIKSSTSKGGAGFNEIRFEDKQGEEQIFIHGEKDFDLRVKNDRKEFVGNERHLTVESEQFSQVKKSKHQMVTEDFFEKIDGDTNLTIGGDRVTKVGGAEHLAIAKLLSIKADGETNIKSGAAHNHQSTGKFSIKSDNDIHLKAAMNMALDGGMEIHIKGGMKVVIEGGMQVSLKAGPSFVDIGPAGVSISGPMVNINSGGSAGSGSGCSPGSPAAPDPPDAPKEPKLPVDAKAGKTSEAPEPLKKKTSKAKTGSSKTRKFENPQAQALADAAKDGTPFCDT